MNVAMQVWTQRTNADILTKAVTVNSQYKDSIVKCSYPPSFNGQGHCIIKTYKNEGVFLSKQYQKKSNTLRHILDDAVSFLIFLCPHTDPHNIISLVHFKLFNVE